MTASRSLSIYTVRFAGYTPVGSVAIVTARCERHARLVLLDTIGRKEPELLERNSVKGAMVASHYCYAPEGARFNAKILLNGDY